MSDIVLRAEGLRLSRGGRCILDLPTFAARKGRVTALVGPNGAGKSTLLRILAQVLAPDAGTLTLAGARSVPLALTRAYMAQSTSLSVALTVEEVVALGRLPHGEHPQQPGFHRRVQALLGQLELGALAGRLLPTLSGGEQQRVQLARALFQLCAAHLDGGVAFASAAPVLLCDEPTSALDVRHQHSVLGALRRYAAAGLCVVVVVHDLNLARHYADDALLLAEGRPVAAGAVEDVLTSARLSQVYGTPFRDVVLPGTARPFFITAPVGASGPPERRQ